eukprot:5479752-Alexandrium_andersonii.AAC.1
MSASLVGSEMCIRDSLRHPPTRRWTPCIERAVLRAILADCQDALLRERPCLLYTSDAADDM